MRFSQFNPLLLLSLLSLPALAVWDDEDIAPPSNHFQEDVLDFLEEYCLRCHEGSDAEAELDFSLDLSEEEARKNPDLYWRAAWKIWDHSMPPPRRLKQPSVEERNRFLAWVDAKDGLGYQPAIQAPVLRRMNRSIYRRSIKALFGVDVPESILESLPPDEAGDGFDNIGSSLTMSDNAVVRYLEAAESIAQLAVVDFNPAIQERMWQGSELEAPSYSGQTAALYSRGSATTFYQAPRDGRYILRIGAWGDQAGDEPCQMKIGSGRRQNKTVEVSSSVGEKSDSVMPLELKKGEHKISAQFINDYWAPNAPEGTPKDRNLYIVDMSIEGPLDPLTPTQFQEDLKLRYPFLLDPKKNASQRESLVSELLTRAWRRAPTTKELKRYTALLNDEPSWEDMVRITCTAIITSPHFLFESTTRPKRLKKGELHPLTDQELATRLSFFLWSSLPNSELVDQLAQLEPATHKAQLTDIIDWMLAQPQSMALAEDFAGQSFRIRGLLEHEVDKTIFPSINQELLHDMLMETHLLFQTILQDDRNLNEFITADYTFLNQRLANHYGIPWIGEEKEWTKHSLHETQSRGILGHASVLTITSMATRTSPVRRGKWIMENILGASPPPPPANAGLLDESSKAGHEETLREKLARHRTDPNCITCHKVMDPLGFSLEHFDPVGRWRETLNGKPVDAGGELPDGTQLEGILDIVDTLQKKGGFLKLFVSRLTSYALGRTLTAADRPLLQNILDNMDSEKPTIREAIHAIVLSEPFLYHNNTTVK